MDTDRELIGKLRGLGTGPALALADLFDKALDPAFGPERIVEEIRAEGESLGKDIDTIFPASGDELIVMLRTNATRLIDETT